MRKTGTRRAERKRTPRERFLARVAEFARLPEEGDAFAWRILAEYGAVFATAATPPSQILYASQDELDRYHETVEYAEADMDGTTVALQREALEALVDADDEARAHGLRIAPRGADSSARSWGDSEELWRGRVERACEHWTARGDLPAERALQVASLDTLDQAAAVLELERSGLWFSTYFDKSILHSVAAPGASQHLSLLAFDVADFTSAAVRHLLSRYGWFQTVVSDLPHFTYLGRAEEDLPSFGLRRELLETGGEVYEFWVPDL